MKSIIYFALLSVALMFTLNGNVIAQTDSTKTGINKIYIVTTYQGGEFVGKIISQDAKEVLIETKDKGQVLIPKYQIREMKEIQVEEITKSGDYIPKQVFSTRYFLTTNGLPIEKGESYLQWNLYGPDFEFGVGKNFGLGIMTSWFGMPIIGTAKYSIPLSKKANLAVGTLLGTGSWTAPDFGIALPFTALTLGDRRSNINFSFGYGAVFSDGQSDGRVLMSVAGMTKVSNKISIVFDSFIMPAGGYHTVDQYYYDMNTGSTYNIPVRERREGFALLIPGLRWQVESNKAFQFGFAGFIFDGELQPFPFPMVQWYRKL